MKGEEVTTIAVAGHKRFWRISQKAIDSKSAGSSRLGASGLRRGCQNRWQGSTKGDAKFVFRQQLNLLSVFIPCVLSAI